MDSCEPFVHSGIINEIETIMKSIEQNSSYNGPTSWLLYGVPGVGKTTIFKNLKAKFGNWFTLSPTPADLLSKWVGESEKGIQKMLWQAVDNKPSLVFLDELESIGADRSSTSSTKTTVVTQLLVDIENIQKTCKSVLFIGATNLPYSLDPAFHERFKTKYMVQLPTPLERAKLLKYNSQKWKVAMTDTELLDYSAQKLVNYSHRDIDIIIDKTIEFGAKQIVGNVDHFVKKCSGRFLPCPCKLTNGKCVSLKGKKEHLIKGTNDVLQKKIIGFHKMIEYPPIIKQDFDRVVLKKLMQSEATSRMIYLIEEYDREYGSPALKADTNKILRYKKVQTETNTEEPNEQRNYHIQEPVMDCNPLFKLAVYTGILLFSVILHAIIKYRGC